jgi:cell division inhibitor SepF
MSTMHKFKAYFGMVPPAEYDDDYLDEPAPRLQHRDYGREGRDYRDDPFADDYRDADFEDGGYADDYNYGRSGGYRSEYAGRRDDYVDDREYADEPELAYAGGHRADVEPERYSSRLAPLPQRGAGRATALRGRGGSGRAMTAGALAVDTRGDLDRLFEEGPLAKITTLRPADYAEARTIGERFRDGSPVIMDLVDLSNADAKRVVDFAAGLAFALRGSFDKVATKVFLLSPADIDVSPEDRRKIAETGFYNHS